MKLMTKAVLFSTLVTVTSITVANNTIVNQAATQTQVVNQTALYTATTVKQALTLKHDAKVQLQGYVVKAIGDEKYQFRDKTGTITVDIDDDLWKGKAVSASTLVTLSGEVDVDYKPTKRVEIEVDAVKF
ncbi:NirD/YgiW/YdeI family stress tolerance protein [Acinetobacter sichuanensis]|uniref:NirD/YgiW/YdeI family stress tolerance protein n=1 Tax=Acinetobacter sichuanensis TaxID=2136183 RepID=UPI0028100161|nr:NirD/YgiW/YdeI family stress tolerance protein [Acinetobacter sichuanensis]MDQ9022210.1 NirD/YgiW/YdeI family stress tolerance protein [Acinetobacter sichuanensis]